MHPTLVPPAPLVQETPPRDGSLIPLGGLNCPGGGGGVCEMKAIHGVKKKANYYPPTAHNAQQVRSSIEIMPLFVHFALFACN